jgi:hypothetical protein
MLKIRSLLRSVFSNLGLWKFIHWFQRTNIVIFFIILELEKADLYQHTGET